ncbi:hypothetical protein D3C71_2031150 [compost metagenome]
MINNTGEMSKKRAKPYTPARINKDATNGRKTITILNNPRLTIAITAFVTLESDGVWQAT